MSNDHERLPHLKWQEADAIFDTMVLHVRDIEQRICQDLALEDKDSNEADQQAAYDEVIDIQAAFRWGPMMSQQHKLSETPASAILQKMRELADLSECNPSREPSEPARAVSDMVKSQCRMAQGLFSVRIKSPPYLERTLAAADALIRIGVATPELQAAQASVRLAASRVQQEDQDAPSVQPSRTKPEAGYKLSNDDMIAIIDALCMEIMATWGLIRAGLSSGGQFQVEHADKWLQTLLSAGSWPALIPLRPRLNNSKAAAQVHDLLAFKLTLGHDRVFSIRPDPLASIVEVVAARCHSAANETHPALPNEFNRKKALAAANVLVRLGAATPVLEAAMQAVTMMSAQNITLPARRAAVAVKRPDAMKM